jgi:ATP-dependent Clp protease protease subunit
MRVEAKDGEATIWIYDAIGEMFGPDAVTAKGVRDRLQALRGIDKLTVRINSPGGMVDEAIAIRTLLSEYRAEKTYKVDGIAASAATVFPNAGDKLQMAPGAMWMIHNPWSVAIGDGNAMRKAAEVADKYRENLVSLYAARTKQKPEDSAAAMYAETWYTASEAMAGGFATEVGDGEPVAAYVDPELFPYRNTPKALLTAALNGSRKPNVSLNAYRVALARARANQ